MRGSGIQSGTQHREGRVVGAPCTLSGSGAGPIAGGLRTLGTRSGLRPWARRAQELELPEGAAERPRHRTQRARADEDTATPEDGSDEMRKLRGGRRAGNSAGGAGGRARGAGRLFRATDWLAPGDGGGGGGN